MTVIEKLYSMNSYQMSIAVKSIAAQLINSICVPIIVNYYIEDNIFESSGLVEDIFILALASSLVPPFVRLIDPWNMFLLLRYKYYND